MFICFQQPENIFIDKATNKVQIGDFGLAKLGFNSETEMSCFTVATAGINICNLSNASIYFDLFCLFVFFPPSRSPSNKRSRNAFLRSSRAAQ